MWVSPSAGIKYLDYFFQFRLHAGIGLFCSFLAPSTSLWMFCCLEGQSHQKVREMLCYCQECKLSPGNEGVSISPFLKRHLKKQYRRWPLQISVIIWNQILCSKTGIKWICMQVMILSNEFFNFWSKKKRSPNCLGIFCLGFVSFSEGLLGFLVALRFLLGWFGYFWVFGLDWGFCLFRVLWGFFCARWGILWAQPRRGGKDGFSSGAASAHQLSQVYEHWHTSKMLQSECRHTVKYFSVAQVWCLKTPLWLMSSKRVHYLARTKNVTLQTEMEHLQVLLLCCTKQHLS